jgi:hypothetical protein
MSGFGRAVPRAWLRPLPRVAASRWDEEYAKDSTRMAHVIAGMFCPSCGVVVGEDDMHASDCIDVPLERRGG